MIDEVAVAIQTVAGREAALKDTLASLKACEQRFFGPLVVAQEEPPSNQACLATVLRVLDNLYRSCSPLCIRLEDDVLVNAHLVANVIAWPALKEQDFGVGWLFHNQLFHMQIQREKQCLGLYSIDQSPSGELKRIVPTTVGSLGVVFKREVLRELMTRIPEIWETAEVRKQQDIAISKAIHDMGLSLYIHDPPLVEHNVAHTSTLAPDRPVDRSLHTTGGRFDRIWVRHGI